MKLIIFDMDGVIFDTIPYARQHFLETHPGMTTEMYNDLHKGNYHENAKQYQHLKIRESDEQQKQRKLNYIKVKSSSKSFDGMKDLLEELNNSKYTIALNTNASEDNVLPLLKKSKIKPYFSFIAAAELTKDKVEKLNLIAKKYNVNKKDVLFITDALGDIRDADTAGIPTVAVTWGVHDKKYFETEKHLNLIGIVNTVAELDNFIKTAFNSP